MVNAPALETLLKRHRSVAIDTSAFIYLVEHHPRYHDLCERIFHRIESGQITACTSTLTLLEVLVGPYQKGNEELVMKYYALLTTYPNLTWLPLTGEIADRAAQIRAAYRLRTPDSIQAASALAFGATAIICNDAAFRKVAALECLLLDDHTKEPA